MKRILVSGCVVVMAVLVSSVLLAQSNSRPSYGTWKMNAAATKFNPGPVPKSLTQTETAEGDGVKVSVEGTNGDGTQFAWSYTANYDGKDNPISGTGAPNGADTVALIMKADNSVQQTFKKDGKMVMLARTVVAQDGASKTIRAKGTDADGHKVFRSIILDKQQ
jgi:hypothetical protein